DRVQPGTAGYSRVQPGTAGYGQVRPGTDGYSGYDGYGRQCGDAVQGVLCLSATEPLVAFHRGQGCVASGGVRSDDGFSQTVREWLHRATVLGGLEFGEYPG